MPIVSPQASRQLSESQYALINPQILRMEDTGLAGIGFELRRFTIDLAMGEHNA
jgi:hypothetical protein